VVLYCGYTRVDITSSSVAKNTTKQKSKNPRERGAIKQRNKGTGTKKVPKIGQWKTRRAERTRTADPREREERREHTKNERGRQEN
jgi:hypothetical protein